MAISRNRKKPKVSVIIPTYNNSLFLKAAIESVLRQTFQDFELIIVNDGSTDNTEQVINQFRVNDVRITYIKQDNFGGLAGPVNKGLKIAQGDYIAILENDDEWLPEKLEKQVKLLEQSAQDVGCAGCHALIVDCLTKAVKQKKNNPITSNDRDAFLRIVYGENFMTTFSVFLLKKEVFDAVGIIDENLKYGADNDFFFRVFQRFNLAIVPDFLVKYNIHGSNLTKVMSVAKIQELEYMLHKHNDLFNKVPDIKSARLQDVGGLWFLRGEKKRARTFFAEAIKISSSRSRVYTKYVFTFFPLIFYKIIRVAAALFKNRQ